MVQGTLWRNQMLYDFLSDCEILRLQFRRLEKFICCSRGKRWSWIHQRPVVVLTHDKKAHGCLDKAWDYAHKHFFEEQIQDNVELSKSTKEKLENLKNEK